MTERYANAENIVVYDDCEVRIADVAKTPTWEDISEFTASVQVSGGERSVAEAAVFKVERPRIGIGKISTSEVTIRVAFTEGTTEPFMRIYAAHQNKDALMIKFTPSTGGRTFWSSENCYVSRCTPPGGSADSGDIVFFEATFRTPTLLYDAELS